MDLRNKRILVTGADGFIGSHLTEALLSADHKVRAFVYYNSFNSWGWIDSFSPEQKKALEVFCGDIRDPNGVRKAMEGVDVVFHLAALIGIPFSYHSPDSYIDTNIKGTLNVLQAARQEGVKKVLVTSTSEVYGTARYVPIDEGHPLQPQSPYSASKISADAMAESFWRSFDLPLTIVRPFNTYGPRQSARAVIPTIITQLLAGSKEIKLGDLRPARDFVYVKDTVKGFIKLAECDKAMGETVNIATGEEISIGDIAGKIVTLINPAASITTDKVRMRPAKSEVERLCGCNKKLSRLTGWTPDTRIDTGICETIQWFKIKSNLHNYKTDIFNV
jgi:NAD dependent epimerase/dehydratase